jgi:hypothetical protein
LSGRRYWLGRALRERGLDDANPGARPRQLCRERLAACSQRLHHTPDSDRDLLAIDG